MEIEIQRYTPDRQDEWNQFVAASKNGTFLFDRGYMDYHQDRFRDHSLMFWRDGELYALLPANVRDDVLYTHQGLTYGGFVLGCKATTVHVMEAFTQLNQLLEEEGIRRVVYKAKPWIYHLLPAEEPLYAMHRTCNYRLLERDISSTIVMQHPVKWKKDRRHGVRVALDRGVQVTLSNDYEGFWTILTENLLTCHGVKPVHTLAEIQLLHSRFPKQIQLYAATLEGRMLGGCVVYVTAQVVHTQYISATPEGKKLGAVDAIIDMLVNGKLFPSHTYLDFGKSTESHSDMLNANLLYQKEGFGARAVCYDTYEWTV